MNAYADAKAWYMVMADRKATREDARVRLAPLVISPPTAKELAAMKRRAARKAKAVRS